MIGDCLFVIGKMLLGNCFINVGWGIGGFKVIPGGGWVIVELIVKGESGLLSVEFGMECFIEGCFIDESVVVGVVY